MIEIFQNIFALSLQIGVLIGIVLLLGRFMKKPYAAVGRYFLWLVLALRLLIPVNLGWINLEDMGRGIQNLWALEKEIQTVEELPDKKYSYENEHRTSEKESNPMVEDSKSTKKVAGQKLESESKIYFSKEELEEENSLESGIAWKIMSILWMIGVIGMVVYEIIIYQSVYKSIQRWRRPAPKEYQKQLELVCREMRISKVIPVYQCSRITSPMIVGLCSPIIILPERKFQKESLYYIYKHELTHFCHGDLYYKLIQTIVRCIYWFQPLIHIMYQQSAFDVELVCDEKVIKNQSETFCQEYSFVLLDTLTTQNLRTFPLSTCFFDGGKKQMKERFKRIMGQNKKRYGFGLFGLLIICAVILGNVSLHPQKDADVSNANAAKASTSSSIADETKELGEKLTQTTNILVIGKENITGGSARADLCLLVTLNPEQKKCYVTEIARDLAVICEGEAIKLSGLYAKYGKETFKKVIAKETGIAIDSMVEVDFRQFENVIDSVSGLNITLTKEEADYLNRTNYIREEKYRNVKEGTQLLNGQQVLGYVRVRKVKSVNEQRDVFGRGERALNIVSAMKEKIKEMDSKNQVSMVSNLYKMVNTNGLNIETVYQIMQAVFVDGYTYETLQIPEADTYEGRCSEKIGSYIEYDFTTSTTLQKLKTEEVEITEHGETKTFSVGVLN